MEQFTGKSRREFLRAATTATFAVGTSAVLAGSASAAPAVQGGRHIAASKIGIQLYTLRDLMAQSVEDTLSFVADVGYATVELAGLFGYSPERFGSLLSERGLKAPSSHVGIPSDAGAQRQLFEDAQAIGHRWVTVPYFSGSTLDEYKRMAEHLNEAGARARRHGLRVGYHNHAHEFASINGRVPYDLLLDETDSGLVDLELDVFWAIAGGVDPIELFERAPRRFPLTHIKGMTSGGGFADVGEGVIDYGEVFAQKSLAGFRYHFVERDDQPHPKETARDSYRYLRNLTYGSGRSRSGN